MLGAQPADDLSVVDDADGWSGRLRDVPDGRGERELNQDPVRHGAELESCELGVRLNAHVRAIARPVGCIGRARRRHAGGESALEGRARLGPGRERDERQKDDERSAPKHGES